VQNLVIHREASELFGFELSIDRKSREAESRYVSDILGVIRELSPTALDVQRGPEKRFAGTCRDFALLLCSMLRATGTPARIRCGFAGYFIPDRWEDHWVTEYWQSENGWTLIDAELGPEESEANTIAFDPLDVPRTQFMASGDAWHKYRNGEADPDKFGAAVVQIQGAWFIRNDMVRDLAALNKCEMLPWDEWGLAAQPFESMSEDVLTTMDVVADLERSGGPLRQIQSIYENDPELKVPAKITSFTTYLGKREVTLR
jgi:hypothetical protein